MTDTSANTVTTVTTVPVRYEVTSQTHSATGSVQETLWVKRTDEGWSIDDGSRCYDAQGRTRYHGLPSNQSSAYVRRFRFSRGEALAIAQRLTATMTTPETAEVNR